MIVMELVKVPILFDDEDGHPQQVGWLEVLQPIADLLADGSVKVEPLFLQRGEFECKHLYEMRVVSAHG
jgi:hypothetical protein